MTGIAGACRIWAGGKPAPRKYFRDDYCQDDYWTVTETES